jgi:predicted  nucleic acid-binding Zn-ribbon protein
MVKSVEQLERNVSASFGYVKKDLLMLNDSISDLHDKIQHLSLNHAALMSKLSVLENTMVKDEKKLKNVVKSKKTKKKVKKSSSKKKPVKKVVKETITYN